MTHRRKAGYFSGKIDAILAGMGKRGEPEIVPFDCVEDLSAARILAGADFSAESRIRNSLKRRLLASEHETAVAASREAAPPIALPFFRKPVPMAIASAVIAGALILAFRPSGMMWHGADAGTIAGRAGGTSAAAETAGPRQRESAAVRTASGLHAMGTFALLDTAPLSQASAYPGFRFPAYMPRGFMLGDIVPTEEKDGFAATYTSDSGPLSLTERKNAASLPAAQTSYLVTLPTGALVVNGNPAIWVMKSRDGALQWDSLGTAFVLEGKGLTPEEALKIARSIK